MTYFSSFFVFDGGLTLVFTVADVSQLVVKQIGCCHRHRHEEQRKHAAHCATDPCHLIALFTRSALASFLVLHKIRISSAPNASGTRYGVMRSIVTRASPRLPSRRKILCLDIISPSVRPHDVMQS